MTGEHRRLTTDADGNPAATADLYLSTGDALIRATLSARGGHLPPGSRAALVDAVIETAALENARHLQACVPLGDAESLLRLVECTVHMHTHPAGASVLVDADLPRWAGTDSCAAEIS